jgi:hypothetical protein
VASLAKIDVVSKDGEPGQYEVRLALEMPDGQHACWFGNAQDAENLSDRLLTAAATVALATGVQARGVN